MIFMEQTRTEDELREIRQVLQLSSALLFFVLELKRR